ncbi:Cof-type HAD-IIB family hydrolase [Rhizorhabdus argentea]|uniref:Cof-type HAD-IIB family hydrolase n=1 Tax=Rhizorhabdus argentea TaxID=1387174 RepID=UPI0030EF4E4E
MIEDFTARLLISDVDGTLLRTDKSLADATVWAVRRLTEAGLPMTLISARPPSGMLWIADALNLDGPFGGFNGGTLFRRDGSVIARHCIEPAVAEAVVPLILRAGATCWVFADDQWLSSSASDHHIPREIESSRLDPVITQDFGERLARADKIIGVSDDHTLLAVLESTLQAITGSRASVSRSQSYYLDITAPEANKGEGTRFLARAHDVPLGSVVVIGDQANDLPMFAEAGLSIAMGQASDLVKSRATVSTVANDIDGVARAIEDLILPMLGDRR